MPDNNDNNKRIIIKIITSIIVGALPVISLYKNDSTGAFIIGILWAIATFLVITAVYMRMDAKETSFHISEAMKKSLIEDEIEEEENTIPPQWSDFKEALSHIRDQAYKFESVDEKRELTKMFMLILKRYEVLVEKFEHEIPDTEKIDALKEIRECSILLGSSE